VKVRLTDEKEIAGLMDSDSHQKYVEEKMGETAG
jgi:hypothetical protein